MKIAIVTGASSGLGAEFAAGIRQVFPEVELLWLIARRADKLEKTAEAVSVPCRLIPADLTEGGVNELVALLDNERPEVALLVNCAGCGYLGNVAELEESLLSRCIDLNVRALTAVTRAVLPYMRDGGRIINVSSIASFCPNPRMTVYGATKSYVTDFSLGLDDELRPQGMAVTAVCPGPMTTEFLDAGGISGNSKMFSSLPFCDAKKVALGSLKAARKGRRSYTPTAFFRSYRFLAKLLPHGLLVKFVRT